jgi:hypothetical protein
MDGAGDALLSVEDLRSEALRLVETGEEDRLDEEGPWEGTMWLVVFRWLFGTELPGTGRGLAVFGGGGGGAEAELLADLDSFLEELESCELFLLS